MSNISVVYYKSPIGELVIGAYENQICLLDWRYRKQRSSIDRRMTSTLKAHFIYQPHDLHDTVIKQLELYFSEALQQFDFPTLLIGTEFQKRVWNELLAIPYGNTVSYLTLSRKLNNEKAIRAVASANGANAISIVIPCHRVIGSNGDLTGYAGGLPAKKKLLQFEGALHSNQLNLF